MGGYSDMDTLIWCTIGTQTAYAWDGPGTVRVVSGYSETWGYAWDGLSDVLCHAKDMSMDSLELLGTIPVHFTASLDMYGGPNNPIPGSVPAHSRSE